MYFKAILALAIELKTDVVDSNCLNFSENTNVKENGIMSGFFILTHEASLFVRYLFCTCSEVELYHVYDILFCLYDNFHCQTPEVFCVG